MQSTRTLVLPFAIKLEMKNVWVTFNVHADGVAPPSDHQYMRCHMIFDNEKEDFHCKARLVDGGHMTKSPTTLTYASIMSQESLCIAIL